MPNDLPLQQIAEMTRSQSAEVVEPIQSLWSGYGEIVRVKLIGRTGQGDQTAIVKHVCPPTQRDHKYGWSGDVSHERKLKSYHVELNWYQHASQYCDESCRVPALIASAAIDLKQDQPGGLLVLEDLDAAGFPLRHRNVNDAQTNACLAWLANFHATFLFDRTESKPDNPAIHYDLWPIGTYWHLATRPDELAAMEDGPLKLAAAKIDANLNNARFQTLVHGDAKLANFCFSPDDQVAAVDFQYVGGGCGMKDVAYFISSCFHEEECERREPALLATYFDHLQSALLNDPLAEPLAFDALEQEWRSLYPVAWADFYRFLAGWSPGHWKLHGYSQRMTEQVLRRL